MAAFRLFVLITFMLMANLAAARPLTLAPEDAIRHIDEKASVCGLVASARYEPSRREAPTFLHLDRAHPNPIFTAVIWKAARSDLAYRPEWLGGRRVCVTGTIFSHHGSAYMDILSAQQIDVNDK